MHVLIVGCGYVGVRAAREWLQRGVAVSALTRSPSRAEELQGLGITPVVGDVLDPESLTALPGADVCLYAVGLDRGAGHDQRTVYVDGLCNVLTELSPHVPRLIYLSSTSVYRMVRRLGKDVDVTARPHGLRHTAATHLLEGGADPQPDLRSLAHHVQAEHPGPARAGPEQAGEDADGGGLPGTVGPQEAEDLSLPDREVDPGHGFHPAGEDLPQLFRLDGVIGSARFHGWISYALGPPGSSGTHAAVAGSSRSAIRRLAPISDSTMAATVSTAPAHWCGRSRSPSHTAANSAANTDSPARMMAARAGVTRRWAISRDRST